MKARTPSILLLLLLLICPLFLCAPAGADSVDKARERLKGARRALDDSEAALTRAYTHLAEEFDKISGPNCPDFLKAVAQVWSVMAPEIQKKWKTLAPPGRRVTERRFEEAVGGLLDAKAADAVRTDPLLIRPFRREATAVMYDALRKKGTFGPGDMLPRFQAILTPHTPFYLFWNKRLFEDLAPARAFAKANVAFAAAKDTPDRLEHPSEFDARGRRAPPGMVFVPGGAYYVGPNTGWERKRRKVKISSFYIDKYEVTNKEFNIFLGSLDDETRLSFMPYFWPKNARNERIYPKDRTDHPVTGVSWRAADAYARWKGGRLPTEEEWEVAAGGKDGRLYPWGDTFDKRVCNTSEAGFGSTVDVGSFAKGASPFGCYDMAGNASEWTLSGQDGKAVKPDAGAIVNVVIRGGSYKDDAAKASCRYRWLVPLSPYEGNRPTDRVIGFRCVKDVR